MTSEKPISPDPNARPSIPNACKHYGVKWLSLPDFFREQKWQF
ncbi:DUF4411 family protein [candidate division WOR-3 bacterium]|nr:DUF4411 family protein [candidate division WOR-3 bacterium]